MHDFFPCFIGMKADNSVLIYTDTTNNLIRRVANSRLIYVAALHFGRSGGYVSRNNVIVVEHEGEAQS